MSRSFFIALFVLSSTLYAQRTTTVVRPLASQSTRGFTTDFLDRISKKASLKVPSLDAFLIWQHDSLIAEHYFHGCDSGSTYNIKSASKSVLSAIAGAAQARGILPDLRTPVLDILPEYRVNRHRESIWFSDDNMRDDSLRNALTLRHLLTMQTGFNWDDFGDVCQNFVSSSDPVRYTLDIPFLNDDDGRDDFNYCSGGVHVFAVALAKLVGSDLRTFADSTLFIPAGMKLQRWNTDAMGRYIGGCDMYFSARDMIRFGVLYLKNGNLNGKQILSKKWIDESTSAQAKLDYWDVLPNANGYGYWWWRRTSGGHQIIVASGVCGQLICIIPDLDMVIVTACSCGEMNGRKEIRQLHLIMDKIIAKY